MDNFVLRPATEKDLAKVELLTKDLGPGLTNIPKTQQTIGDRIALSNRAFSNLESAEKNFFFVLEDISNNSILGCCAIFTGVGVKRPNYHYRLSHITQVSKTIDKKFRHRLLNFSSDLEECNEVASLFLHKKLRGTGCSRLLGLSRYLFMANNIQYFNDTTFADVRGYFDNAGKSPFWELFMSKFFGVDYLFADLHSVENFQFIADLIPRFPIYINLLPQAAQDAIGKFNNNSYGAANNLLKQGFVKSEYVDIFDGGPCYICKTKDIKTINNSKILPVTSIVKTIVDTKPSLVSNTKIIGFKAIMAKVELTELGITIEEQSAKLLNVELNEKLSIL